ncbi:MAG TPA: hypothetical protein VLX09_26760 [Stellaceae bacterium]|nr:hypothetical protein [Stellaceae bacterium]
MGLIFITGGDHEFFPTLLGLLQTFSERIAGAPLLVCDFGLRPPEQEFLRRRGLLLERPARFGAEFHPYQLKTAMHIYLSERRIGLGPDDTLIWLDGDLLMMSATREDYEGVAAELAARDLEIAICQGPDRHTVGEAIDFLLKLGLKAEPFARVAEDAAIDLNRPYCSTGFFLCRSAGFLERWCNLSLATEHHNIIDQNMFNVVLHRSTKPALMLDCEIWQAQHRALDAVQLAPEAVESPRAAFIGEKEIKALHVTSPFAEHVFVGPGRFSVREFALDGIYKLYRRRDLMMLQLNCLGRFLMRYGGELLALGRCIRLPQPIEGLSFQSLEGT